MPGMQYVAFVRSPHAHARIRGIDAPAGARSARGRRGGHRRGAQAALQARPRRRRRRPRAARASGVDSAASTTRSSIDRVRHVGEAVAAVIGHDRGAAVDGAAAVEVDWEPLPAVADTFAAMADGAPAAPRRRAEEHRAQAPASRPAIPTRPSPSAHKVVKQRMNSQRLCGVPMETRAVRGRPRLRERRPHGLGHATRRPTCSAARLADALGMPRTRSA